jgi:hypothetical protein
MCESLARCAGFALVTAVTVRLARAGIAAATADSFGSVWRVYCLLLIAMVIVLAIIGMPMDMRVLVISSLA